MLEHLGKSRQAADEIDHEHSRDGVAAELIHRHDPGGRSRRRTHAPAQQFKTMSDQADLIKGNLESRMHLK